MATPLLATKLSPPPLFAAVIDRGDLVARLATATTRLILIVAPPGFGKTTLASSWLAWRAAQPPVLPPFAWLSLDPRDNDPTRFWGALLAALGRTFPGCGDYARALLQSPQPPPMDVVLGALLDDLVGLSASCLLVLDDYHVIDAPDIHAGVATLIERLPRTTQMVILSRREPPLPLGRLRVRGELSELRAGDLRFSYAETAAFLHAHDLRLTPDEVRTLTERTEGWPGALQLAVLALRAGGRPQQMIATFAGSDRNLVDYLAEEVLARQPTEWQHFLLTTCVLDTLCADLCGALLDDPPYVLAGVLEALERAGLFLHPLDQERRWYRYHALFAEFLRERLRRDDPTRLVHLHRRAAAWYTATGLPVEAVGHWLAAGDYEHAALLVGQEGRALLLRSEVATVLGWLQALPPTVVRARPGLCLIEAWALAVAGQFDAVALPLEQVAAILDQANAEPDSVTPLTAPFTPRNMRSEILAVRATVAGLRRDTAQTMVLARAALAEIPADSVIVRSVVALLLGSATYLSGDMAAAETALKEAERIGHAAGLAMIAIFAVRQLGELYMQIGQLHRAARTYQDAITLGTDLYPASDRLVGRPVPVAGTVYVGLGRLRYEWNELDLAEALFADGLRLGRQGANIEIMLMGPIGMARLQRARGDTQAAWGTMTEALVFARSTGVPRLAAWLGAEHARLAVMMGRLADAVAWDQERRLASDAALSYLEEIDYMALAHLRVAQQRPLEARHLLGRLRTLAETEGRQRSSIEIEALDGLAAAAAGDQAAARAALLRALTLAEPEGYLRTFVDLGAPLYQLLSDYRVALAPRADSAARRTLAYIDRILAAFPAHMAEGRHAPAPTALLEPLTPRELEVLALVAAGLSNQQIAEHLVLGVSTVKKHINNIYGKLDVPSRTQALKRARELGLIV